MKARAEIDFIRLLKQCQGLADQNDWRLEKYVDALSDKLDELRNLNVCRPNRATLEAYGRKIQFLRGLIDTERLPSAEKRLLAAELLSPDQDSKGAHLRTTSKYANQIRDELLLSRRRPDNKNDNDQADEIDENLTKNLLELASNLKENITLANHIIKKDTETLNKASNNAENNTLRIQTNIDRLGEFVRKGFQYKLWAAIVLVTWVFFSTVIFIRLFPKRYTPDANKS